VDYSRITATWWSGNCYHIEQLNAIISSTDVKAYAYILHDKCFKDDNSGELKKPHYHYLVQLQKNQRGSWFKQFSTEDMGLVFFQPCRIPENAYNYLIHDTDICRKQKKLLYDPGERVSTIETFDEPEKEEDEHTVLFADVMSLVNKEIMWSEFLKRKPKRIHMISNIKTAHDLLLREYKFDNTFRILDVAYIYGQTEKGKTKFVMEKYGYRNVYRVTKYDHTAFDGYRGQDVVVFEEFRSSFKIEDMLNYLDGYPLMLPSRYNDKEARYTKVYITTNWTLGQQYKNVQAEHPTTWAAFLRRIHKVYNFDLSKDIPVGKATGTLIGANNPNSELISVDPDDLPFYNKR